ncbi:MAG: helix-turn-helix domain-containing protein [Planctomycetota bacterium]
MPSTPSPVRILWAARYDYAAGDVLNAHQHEHWQALCILTGSGCLQIGDAHQQLQAGLALLPPGIRHGLRARSGVRSLDVKFHCTDRQLERALQALPTWIAPIPSGWADGIAAIVAAGRSADRWSRPRAEIRLSGMLLDLLPAAPTACPERPTKRACTDPLVTELHRRFVAACDEAWDQERIARISGYSYRQVGSRCRAATGLTPQALLETVRLEAAADLLLASDYTVEAVAIRCGFAHGQHLSRRFRGRHGISPAAWRARERERIGIGVTFASDFSNPDLVDHGG